MTTDDDGVRQFLRAYGASAVGPSPQQPTMPDDATAADAGETIDRTIEFPEANWEPVIVPEAPAKDGEFPVRFIDGSHAGLPVLCIRSPLGWPIPLILGEVGAVGLTTVGRRFERDFAAVERVLSFVADPFPWEEIEAFASAILNQPALALRVLPANRPPERHNPFDYEVMRTQAYNRAQAEMHALERLALRACPGVPTLVDGPLDDISGEPKPGSALLVGVTKRQFGSYLHEAGWRTLLDLRPGQRTPTFRLIRVGRPDVATWFLKLAGGPRLAPNWGYVRVEVPYRQFESRSPDEFGFVNRLSRWLIDARCRTDSYARMPVSLDPIVRAEEVLKPLFTPLPLLATRLYKTAGLFRGHES